jgi:hypothetical protein
MRVITMDDCKWVAATGRLNDKGRCCGRKPIVYRGSNPRLFCCRCDREFDPATGDQRENWAWRKHENSDCFVRRS